MGVKVWAEVPLKKRLPVAGVRELRAEKSAVVAATYKVELPKWIPPPVMVKVVVTEWLLSPEPRLSTPAAMVRCGVVKLLVLRVVPPDPFWVRFKAVTEALGV